MKSGIYCIINILNGKMYIGSSNNLPNRISNHKYSLKKGDHPNRHLQSAYKLYGVSNFKYEIIELCPIEELLNKEQHYIKKIGMANLYNLSPCSRGPLGYRHTLSAKIKIAKASKMGPPPPNDPETRRKIANSLRGRIAWNKGRETSIPPWNFGTKGICKGSSTSFKGIQFSLMSPKGEIFKGVSVRPFAESKGLHTGHLCEVIKGKRNSYNGWTRFAPEEN